jgi:ketosteroid isomerase-like protein
LRSLNTDIWRPFSDAYNSGEVERFLSLHAPEFVWVRAPTGAILGLDQYATAVRDAFADWTARGIRFTIAFRFVERIASAEHASERGIFRLAGEQADGPSRVLHGRFHTFARRTDAGWRLVVDYEDSDAVGAADFEPAYDLDDAAAAR